MTNLLSRDAIKADYINRKEPFDIISLDFQHVFDKVPHLFLIKVLGEFQFRNLLLLDGSPVLLKPQAADRH